jgi:16S rRNA (cytosine967-C5)-methyltransferase
MIAPARAQAYEILRRVSEGRATLPGAIATGRARLKDERDRALAAEIAAGVQRWRAALDHLIVQFSGRPITGLDPEIVEILRLSAYQLLHLTRVPASAIVDDAVDLARRAHKHSATGFVNAVLRAISRKETSLPLPKRPDPPADREAALDYLSVTLSHPRWLVSRWLDRFGFDATERWLQFNNIPALLCLRANRLHIDPETLARQLQQHGISVRRGRYAPDALVVEGGHPLQVEDADGRLFVVQDEAAQLVPLLAKMPVERVLDTCASPGGKTTALASAMNDSGLVVACDLRDRRMRLLRRTVRESGATNVRLVQADLARPLPFARPFDCVLVDVPCSGLGTLRRDPDTRWRRRPEELAVLAASQLEMLCNAAAVVTRGGRLIYATCSSEPEENDDVVSAFVRAMPEFSLVDLRGEDTLLPPDVIDDSGYLRTLPHVHALEAFFGAVFRRDR